MKIKPYFQQHRTALTTLVILIVGVLLIQAALMFMGVGLLLHRHRSVSPRQLSYEVVRALRLAKVIPQQRLPRHLHLLNGRGLRVSITSKPPKNAEILMVTRMREIRRLVERDHRRLLLSYQLAPNQWLNLRSRARRSSWLPMSGMLAVLCVLIAALIALCIWAVRRLSLPVKQFVKASRQFGLDVNAPPMAVTGPSEIREVIQSFNEMQHRIRRLIDDRTQMLVAISHDLRTPITRLQLRTEYLTDKKQYTKAIEDLTTMENMITSILSFARDYARSETAAKFDLNALLESLCNDLQDAGKPVAFTGNQRITYLGRIDALKRAFANLIENAVKYGKRAKVSIKQEDEQIVVTINDRGPGLAEAEMENVFKPFYRVDAARSPEKSGTGLGLAVARDIIRTHGGDIKLCNLKPTGLSVIVQLPLR
jgi:signal transduction histidine kinase